MLVIMLDIIVSVICIQGARISDRAGDLSRAILRLDIQDCPLSHCSVGFPQATIVTKGVNYLLLKARSIL